MDILVTFEDGTTELRAAESPYLSSIDLPPRSPSEERWYLPPYEGAPLSFCGRPVREIGQARGFLMVYVWRITGGWGEGEPLTGEWQSCRVETVDEQIARLTRERDEARLDRWAQETSAKTYYDSYAAMKADRDAQKARAGAAEKRLGDLRTSAAERLEPHRATLRRAEEAVDERWPATAFDVGAALEDALRILRGEP